MRVMVQLRAPNRSAGWRALHSAELLFWLVGILALGYCGWVYLESKIYQTTASWEFDREWISPALHAVRPATVRETLASGAPIGRIEIPRVAVSAMIVEGVGSRDLRKAVGHIPGTALPGDAGNIGIAGHRDTFFRELRNIKANDLIRVSTLDGTYEYFVESTRIVSPKQTDVLESGKGSVLTLVTCYPFYYVGDSPDRFIVRARQAGLATDSERSNTTSLTERSHDKTKPHRKRSVNSAARRAASSNAGVSR